MRQDPGIGGDGAAAETFFDDAIAAAERGLKYARPTPLEAESASIDGVVSPRDRIPVAQDGLHVTSQSRVRTIVDAQRTKVTGATKDGAKRRRGTVRLSETLGGRSFGIANTLAAEIYLSGRVPTNARAFWSQKPSPLLVS